jgi:hypothetical protein
LHNNIFELKVHFESKIILIQWLNEEDWIKSMYTKNIIYNFSAAIRLHVYDSWNITKKKKTKKIMHCPSIKSPLLWYGSGVFLKIRYYYAFITKQMQKNTFLERNFIQNFKIFLDLIDIYQYHTPLKISPKIPSITLVSKSIYWKFQILWQVLFCHKYTPYVQIFNFCWFFQNNWLDEV